jgi:hypothetical protein
MPDSDKILEVLMDLSQSSGKVHEGVRSLGRSMDEVKARLDKTITRDECSATQDRARVSRITREAAAKPSWWESTGKKLGVIATGLGVLGMLITAYVVSVRVFNAVEKQVKVTTTQTREQRRLTDEQRQLRRAFRRALSDIKERDFEGPHRPAR